MPSDPVRSARQEAVEAMVECLVVKWREEGETWQIGPGERQMARSDAAAALSAIPPSVLARLAIETGGMEHAAWEEPSDTTPFGVSGPAFYAIKEGEDPDELPYWWNALYRLAVPGQAQEEETHSG